MQRNDERLSVLVITPGFPPHSIAGTEQHVRSLVSALGDRCDFRVLTRDASASGGERGDIVVRTAPGPKTGSVDELVAESDPVFEAAVLREVRDFGPDLAHIHHWVHLSNSLVRLLAEQRLPVVATLHDYYPMCARLDLLRHGEALCPGPEGGRACAECLPPPGAVFADETPTHRLARIVQSRLGLKGAAQGWIRERATKVFAARLEHMRGELARASAIISPSQALRREISAVWPEMESRIRVVPHGVETAWGELVQRAPSQRLRFAYLGIITPRKGVEVLLEAFGKLDARTATLGLWGACPDAGFERRITAMAGKLGVALHGRYQPGDLPRIFSQVDVVVAPSTWKETASLVVREAFVGGAPVIASALGALPEAVEDGHNGLLARAGDATDVAEKMRAVAENRELLARLRAGVRPPKSIAECADETAAVYAQAMDL